MIRWRRPLLVICLALGLAALPFSLRLQFDRSIERLFHQDDPRLANYLEAKEIFGGLETCLVAYSDPDLLTAEGLVRLERLSAELAKVPGVEQTLSLAQARLPSAPLSPQPLRSMLASGAVTSERLREELAGSSLYRNRLLSSDGQTTALLVTLSPADQAPAPRGDTIQRLRRVAAEHERPTVIAGGPVLVDDVFRHLEQDGRKLGIFSTLALTLVIAVLFRNVRWVLLPLAVVHLTLVWTKGLLVLSGMKLSMVSSPLVALVTVIGVATVVHVTIRFREERAAKAPPDALRSTLAHVGPAIFWTSLTTVAGFASLLASRIVPVQNFGLMMALGSLLVFVAAIALVPGGALLGRAPSDPGRAPGEGKVTALLTAIIAAVEHRPWSIALAGAAILGATSVGVTRLESATDFTENFHESSPIVKSYRFLGDRLGVTGGFDVLIDAPRLDDPAFKELLDQMRALQAELASVEGVVGTLSAADLLDFMQPKASATASLMEQVAAALWTNLPPGQQLSTLAGAEPRLAASFWSQERNVLRIAVQTSHLRGAQAKRELVESVERAAQRRFPSARTAGADILLTYLVQSLMSDQWITFGLAVAAIFLMLSAAFRDWRLGLLALAPNVAPILIVVGAMGWLGLKVNVATAMLASVSMGLAVDFSIHYLYRFRREMQSGKDFYLALRDAHGTVGLAMALSNLALVAGFLVLTLSDFVPTVQFGVLVTVAMLGGLAANLVALPVLLRMLRALWPDSLQGGTWSVSSQRRANAR